MTTFFSRKLAAVTFPISLGFALGVSPSEKLKLATFLFLARVFRGKGDVSRSFAIRALGQTTRVHIRNNFADAFILHEVFRANEYESQLPSETPETIFDIGANIGLITLYFTLRYPETHIYSFEPDPDSYQQLIRNTQELKNVTCYPIAIGAQNGHSTFYQSSVFHMRNSLLPEKGSTEISVEVITLGEALLRTELATVDLIKVDVEGGERDIFVAGAPLSRVRTLIGELHPYRMTGEEYTALLERLKEHFTLTLTTEGKKVFVYGKQH